MNSIHPNSTAIQASYRSAPPDAASLVREVLTALRGERQVHNDQERALTDDAMAAAREQAEHAKDRASALEGQAWLNFGMAMADVGASAASLGVDASRQGHLRQGDSRSAQLLEGAGRVMERTVEAQAATFAAARATDDLVGFGGQERAAQARADQAEARQTIAQAQADRSRDRLGQIDDAIGDIRQSYRDINSGPQGGAS